MRFIDSHLHLSEYQEPLSSLRQARSSETLLLSSGIDAASSLKTLELARREPGMVKAFVGVHPSEAHEAADLGWFEGALREAAGAGELGLDPKYSEVTPRSAQMTAFVRQLQGVERARKPVQVHSRGAEKECLEVLETHRVGKVLLHWFQGEAQLREAEDMGYFVSFGPALLHSRRLQRMASGFHASHVLAESDGPVGFGALGGAEGPSLIPSVVFKLAEIWRVKFSEAEERILDNSLAYLGAGGKT